jgi:hypothetical protein
MTKAILAAAVAAIAVMGCAVGEPRMMAKQCEAPKDTVVKVTDGSYVSVGQDPIYVCKKNVKITWVIDPNQTSQYEFRADSIVVKDPDNEFANCKGLGNGGELDGASRIKCTDKNDKLGQPRRGYKYEVKVYLINGGAAGSVDPHIMND